MNFSYKLLQNSNLLLADLGEDRIGIYKQNEIINIKEPLLNLSSKNLYLEEVSLPYKNQTGLLKIFPWKNDTYYIELLKIDLQSKKTIKIAENISTIKPQKLSNNIYLIKDTTNKICLFRKNMKSMYGPYSLYPIEQIIRNSLMDKKVKPDLIELKPLDYKKNPNIHELTISFGHLDTLHTYLKIDNNINIYNTFYSEISEENEQVFIERLDKDKFIPIDDASSLRTIIENHKIINKIEYLANYEKLLQERQKNKIRAKIWHQIPRKEN